MEAPGRRQAPEGRRRIGASASRSRPAGPLWGRVRLRMLRPDPHIGDWAWGVLSGPFCAADAGDSGAGVWTTAGAVAPGALLAIGTCTATPRRCAAMKPAWAPHLAGRLLMLAVALATEPVPRMTFQRGDSSRILTPFSKAGVLNYDTFLLGEDGATLYVGARDAVLAFDISSTQSVKLKGEIPWSPVSRKKEECAFKKNSNESECFNFIRILVQLNETHLYTCGTYAFSPTCAYVDLEKFALVADVHGQPILLPGKGLCPFDPQHQNTVTFVDGELYTGTMNNFQGNEPIISRTLGSRTSLKTDSFLSWLHADASFVASFNIPTPPDDEKVYFFFEETAKEFDFFEKLTVSRVARVCKNDVGGDKVLQRKWTTFLKAQLSCARQGQFPYAVVRHVFALPQPGGGTIFYGVFASQWRAGGRGSSAVCAFSLDAIRRAFDGKYKELSKDCFRWVTYGGPAMEPRPGSCSVGPSSDKALTFVKEHFLMDEKVEPVHHQPLLVQHDVQYTRIAVHQARDVSGTPYDVMFMGTDRGLLHKAVAVGSGAHIIEEIRLFEKPEAVRNLLLSPEKGVLYVGCSGEVLQVPLANCSAYATCAECVLARDPYCAWDGHRCRDLRDAAATEDTSEWLQDVATGKPGLGCQRSSGKARVLSRPRSDPEGGPPKVLSAPLNSIVRLPCPRASALASYAWEPPEKTGRGAAVREDGQALLVVVQRDTLGTYECWASENGWRHRVAHFQLRSPGGVEASPMGQRHSYWVQFVSVTVLLSVTLAVAAAVAFFSYHDKLKARSKVQGCSTPEASKASGQEKALLSSGLGAPQGEAFRGRGPCPEAAGGSKACCVQLDADFQDTDAENNRLNSGLANGSDSGGLRL